MNKKQNTIVYLMPGLAANEKVFDFINLGESFDVFKLSWIMPHKDEPLKHYCKRLAKKIKHDDPVLVGVSFGGIIVQEISKIISFKKVIIISSVKSMHEYPIHMQISRKTKAYKIFPVNWINDFEAFVGFIFGPLARKKMEHSRKYLSYRDPFYLEWALDAFFNWKQKTPLNYVIHIHGTYDMVFPIIYLKEFIPVKGGTHAMIIFKKKWFNDNMPKIILDD